MTDLGGSSSGGTSVTYHVDTEDIGTYNAPQQEADAKEAAIRDLPSPVGYRRCLVPPPSGNRSSVYDHGVRFEQDCDQREPKKQKWFCASSQRCRKLSMQGKGGIHCQDNGTGNVTRHLRDAHNITTKRALNANKAKAAHTASASQRKAAVKASDEP
ncbi:unnamed protein product, partial [Pylaiella littoralis]